MGTATHTLPFLAVHGTPVAQRLSVYSLHGMENSNCRRMNELTKT
jgi:hypothetical protein